MLNEFEGSQWNPVNSKLQLTEQFGLLENSTFTVCLRIRPKLPFENIDEECCITPIQSSKKLNPCDILHEEQCQILTQKINFKGQQKTTTELFSFDKVFSQTSSNEEVFEAVGNPLCSRVLNGQVGVILAFRQTSSGECNSNICIVL